MISITYGLRPYLLIKSLRLFGKPAIPDGTMALIGDPFRLRAGRRRPPQEPLRKLILLHNLSFEKRLRPSGAA